MKAKRGRACRVVLCLALHWAAQVHGAETFSSAYLSEFLADNQNKEIRRHARG